MDGLGQQILPSARTAGNEDGRGKGDKDNSSRRVPGVGVRLARHLRASAPASSGTALCGLAGELQQRRKSSENVCLIGDCPPHN